MARMRSPNYPSIPLPQAIDLIKKIFSRDRTNVIDKDVAAGHMDYTSLNGRTLKLLGALSQYDLLDKVGKGKVRVSATAVSILHGEPEEKSQALLSAASSPPLFKRIRDNYDSPSDATITSFLMREGFTDAAVGPVLKSYSDTNAFLAANGVSKSHGNAEEEGSDSDLEDATQEEKYDSVPPDQTKDRGDGVGVRPPLPPKAPSSIPLNVTKPLFDFETITIVTTIDNEEDAEELVKRINQVKGMLLKKFVDDEANEE